MRIDVLMLAHMYEMAGANNSSITLNAAACIEMAGVLRELAERRKEAATHAPECTTDH